MASDGGQGAEIAAYEFTTEVIVCLERVFKDRAGAKFRQRPKMMAGTTPVTPDMVFEAEEGSSAPGYRAVGEIKASFPRHPSALDKMVKQIRHYDGDLGGWRAGRAAVGRPRAGHDIIIAIRLKQASAFARLLPAELRGRGAKITKPLSILGIVRKKGEDGDIFTLKKISGKILHAKTDAAPAKGMTVNAYDLLEDLNTTKFYDSMPPLPYIMAVLWINISPTLFTAKSEESYTCPRRSQSMSE